jgi:hypothetical protein
MIGVSVVTPTFFSPMFASRRLPTERRLAFAQESELMYALFQHNRLAVLLAVCGLFGGGVAGIVAGYEVGRESHQNVNDLLTVGYTLVDPDGYEVSNFEEGISTVLERWSEWSRVGCYWTKQEKPHGFPSDPFQ